MGIAELFLVAVGLSMDAFAVAICKGLGMRRLDLRQAAVIALFFGGFQALMPVIGWALGSWLEPVVTPIDHWIAFGLLAFIGAKMIWDACHEDADGDRGGLPGGMPGGMSVAGDSGKGVAGVPGALAVSVPAHAPLDLRELLMLAIATSIDALAVGVTFAFLQVSIVSSALFIGVVTSALSLAGVAIGHQFGSRWEKPSAIVGGVVLILIGVKILFEHLGVLVP